MTTSDPDNKDGFLQLNGSHLPGGIPGGGGGSVGDYADLQALANLASEMMDTAPTAWKESRGSYAANINEVFLKNMPESIKQSGWAVPNQDQLHRLPETIAKGDTPKTPLANRDLAMEKLTRMLEKEQMANLPYAFLQEMRSIVSEDPNDWAAPLVSSMNAFSPAMENMLDAAQMESAIRALESSADRGAMTPQMPGFAMHDDLAGAATASARAFSFLADLSNPFYPDMPGSAGFQPASMPGIPSIAMPTGSMPMPTGSTAMPDSPIPSISMPGTAGFQPASSKQAQRNGAGTALAFDLERVRRDFPILQEKINGHDLVWLDNAATTQKPLAVIERLDHFYRHENSNIHRAAHTLAARSTDAYEAARETVRRFINAAAIQEIVFVRGATEAINLVAQSWGRQNLKQGDEVVITHLEHHANIVPWQMVCAETGAVLKVAPVDDLGQVILEEYERLLSHRTKFVSFTQVSNALGTVTPVREMVAAAHRYGALVLVDGAQAISHMAVDVQSLGCDFYVFSGHKVFGPTGIGVLYGRTALLETMRPWQGGGNMIKDVTFERTIYQGPPVRFEAGTGSIADAVGLGAAIEYIERIGMVNIHRHENDLLAYGTQQLSDIPGLQIIGKSPNKAGVLSFVLDGFRTDEVSTALNLFGIAVRGGHHCAQPILRRFGLESTVRPSLALYNSYSDIDALCSAIWNLKQGRSVRPH